MCNAYLGCLGLEENCIDLAQLNISHLETDANENGNAINITNFFFLFSGFSNENSQANTSVNEEIRCIFFEDFETKSLDEFREMSAEYGDKVTSHLAQYFTQDGATPVLLAIQYGRLDLVKYLIKKMKAPQNQTGRFLWEAEEYLDVPPLFAAIISD